MTLRAQQITIAVFCGWSLEDAERGHSLSQFSERVPDYLNDLNAIHTAEELLTPNQRIIYLCHLSRLGTEVNCIPGTEEWNVNWEASTATATQRSDALLKVIADET